MGGREASHIGAAAAYSTWSSRYYALVVLLAIQTLHNLDRSIVGVVTEPLREEFRIGDGAIGLIAMGYTAAFVLAMLPVGLFIDRVNRIKLLAVLVSLWGSLTALAGLATTVGALMLARAGVGAAEAGGHPTAASLISDIFPKHRRGFAMGMFYLAPGLGGVLAFLGGGYLAAEYGWRVAFFMAGAPGVLIAAILAFTLRHPTRGGSESEDDLQPTHAPSIRTVFRFLVRTPMVLNLALGAMIGSAMNGTFATWLAAYFARAHHLDLRQIGVVGSLGHGVLLSAGALASGLLADRMARDKPYRAGIVGAGALFLVAPIGVAFALTPDVAVAVGLSLVLGFLCGAWLAPTFTMLLNVTEPHMRGAVTAAVQIFSAIGSGVGPYLVGLLSDSLGGQIRLALAVGLGCALLGALQISLAIRHAGRLESAVAAMLRQQD